MAVADSALKAAVSCALAGHHRWPLGRTASWSVRALPRSRV